MKKSEIKAWAEEFKFPVPTDKLMNDLGAEYKTRRASRPPT